MNVNPSICCLFIASTYKSSIYIFNINPFILSPKEPRESLNAILSLPVRIHKYDLIFKWKTEGEICKGVRWTRIWNDFRSTHVAHSCVVLRFLYCLVQRDDVGMILSPYVVVVPSAVEYMGFLWNTALNYFPCRVVCFSSSPALDFINEILNQSYFTSRILCQWSATNWNSIGTENCIV